MKKGFYYVGDPCYIFEKSWREVLDKTNYFEDGEHTLFGKTVFGGGTAYGDGSYKDNFGRKYAVDAGLLAIIPVSLIEIDKKLTRKEIEKDESMHIVKMENDFTCEVYYGIFRFGDIVINTKDEDEEDDDDR